MHEYFRPLIQSGGKKGEGILMGVFIHVSSLSAWKPIKPITIRYRGKFPPGAKPLIHLVRFRRYWFNGYF
jgi:hypothetical protein